MRRRLHRQTHQRAVSKGQASLQLAISVVSIALFATGAAGAIAAVHRPEVIGIFVFSLIGFGAAILYLFSAASGLEYLAFSCGLSVASTILVGSILAEFNIWSTGPVVFWALGGVCTSIHGYAAVTELRSWRKSTNEPTSVEGDAGGTDPDLGRARRGLMTYLIASVRLLVPVSGFALCMGAAFARTNVDPGVYGIFKSLPAIWFVGLGLLGISIGLNCRRSAFLLGTGVVLTDLALTLTPAIIYAEPRYPWTEKHIGVTAYILQYGSVNRHVDLYQAWPGFFAGMAWLCRTSGLGDLFTLAKWWPPACDLVTLIAFVYFARVLGLTTKRAWLAGFIFVTADTIGQDYYSPQSVSFFLALILFAAAYKTVADQPSDRFGKLLVFIPTSLALAITHQITPYIVFVALCVLAIFRRTTAGRWTTPVAVVAPSAVWALLHIPAISPYINLNQIGRIFSNIQTTGAKNRGARDTLIIHLSTGGELGCALIVAWLALWGFRSVPRENKWIMAVCGVSPIGLVVVSSYGNEGLLRVYLFALPWLAIAAGHAQLKHLRVFVPAGIVVGSVLLIAGYLLGDMALDYVNVVRPGDVAAARVFEFSAPRRSVLITIGNGDAPTNSTQRYPQFGVSSFERVKERGSSLKSVTEAANAFTRELTPTAKRELRKDMSAPVYALLTQESAAAEATTFNTSAQTYKEFGRELVDTHGWALVYGNRSASLYLLVRRP